MTTDSILRVYWELVWKLCGSKTVISRFTTTKNTRTESSTTGGIDIPQLTTTAITFILDLMHQRPERTHHILQIGVMFSLRLFPRLKIDNVLSGRPAIHAESVITTNLAE